MDEAWHQEPRVAEGQAAMARLAALDVPIGALLDALRLGDAAAQQADEYSPVMAAGSFRWITTTTEARRLLARAGWTPNDDRNQPRSFHPGGRLGITVVGGDRRTGLVGFGEPRSARPHGPAISRQIDANEQTALDMGPVDLADMSAERHADVVTYVLLYFRAAERLRAELSLPSKMDERSHIAEWRERIVLPDITFDPVQSRQPRDASPDDDVPFPVLAV